MEFRPFRPAAVLLSAVGLSAVGLSACGQNTAAEPDPTTEVSTVTRAAPPVTETVTTATETATVVTDTPVAPDGTVDVTDTTLVGNGDAIFLTPDSTGLCWLYGPGKSGGGLCTLELSDPPAVQPPGGPPGTANAISFGEGITWTENVAVGHAPPSPQVLRVGDVVDFRGIRCEALSDTELECSHDGMAVVYADGTVTPEPRLP